MSTIARLQINKQTPVRTSVADVRTKYESYEKYRQAFEATRDAIQLIDLTKNESRTFTVFSRERLRQYMQNPKSNESNLRQLSQFLYRVSHPYRRLINYQALHVDLTAQTVIPLQDFSGDMDVEKTIKNYYSTVAKVHKVGLDSEIFKCLVIAWREDCFFGYVYEDEQDFFIMPLDGNYCKVSSTNYDGTLNFAFDFSYFRSHQELLEYWDPEFQSKYNSYSSDNTLRWQELDPARTMCFKVNLDDPTLVLPPFLALFEQMIDLIDLQSIQKVKDELSIYKMLVARIKPIDGTDIPDDWEVDIDTAIEYYNKLEQSVPDEVACILSPLPIEPIEFKETDTSDDDMISKSMSNLMKQAGGSQILDNDKSGATIFKAQIIFDTQNALRPVLSQINKWINRYIGYELGDDHSYVKYFPVSPWTKQDYKENLLNSAQYGVPTKLAVAALDGFDPLETLSMEFLENECFKLHERWIPLQSSYTQSSDGSNEKDDSELTDEGAETKEKEKNEE